MLRTEYSLVKCMFASCALVSCRSGRILYDGLTCLNELPPKYCKHLICISQLYSFCTKAGMQIVTFLICRSRKTGEGKS